MVFVVSDLNLKLKNALMNEKLNTQTSHHSKTTVLFKSLKDHLSGKLYRDFINISLFFVVHHNVSPESFLCFPLL